MRQNSFQGTGTSPPGDFDVELADIAKQDVERHEGEPTARLTIVVNVTGEDARRLDRIAAQRDQPVDAVVSDLLREADRHAA